MLSKIGRASIASTRRVVDAIEDSIYDIDTARLDELDEFEATVEGVDGAECVLISGALEFVENVGCSSTSPSLPPH